MASLSMDAATALGGPCGCSADARLDLVVGQEHHLFRTVKDLASRAACAPERACARVVSEVFHASSAHTPVPDEKPERALVCACCALAWRARMPARVLLLCSCCRANSRVEPSLGLCATTKQMKHACNHGMRYFCICRVFVSRVWRGGSRFTKTAASRAPAGIYPNPGLGSGLKPRFGG